MKNDYAYIATIDKLNDFFVRKIQQYLYKNYSKSQVQWPPHITLARGNYLTDSELSQVKEKLSLLKSLPNFTVETKEFVFKDKAENKYSLRIAIKKNKNIQNLSQEIVNATKEFETPIKNFTQEEYWITIYDNLLKTEKSEIKEYLETLKIPSKIAINNFSIFYSTFNENKPKEAYEIERFILGGNK